MTDVLLFDALPEYLRDQITAGSSRCICPKCDGGTNRESSLDVRQEETGVMRLKCWRSTCDWYGITVTDPNAKIQSKNIKPPTVFRDPIVPVSGPMERRLVLDYGLTIDVYKAHGWGMNEAGDQLIMPVKNPYGHVRGHVTRTFESPKRCYTFKATAQPWLDWWPGATSDTTILVEDCLSACRLSGLGYQAVALLGTSISVDQAKEIAVQSCGPVYIALDNDAFAKSLKLVLRHKHIVQMKPVLLLEDIKSTEHDDEIRRLFSGRA